MTERELKWPEKRLVPEVEDPEFMYRLLTCSRVSRYVREAVDLAGGVEPDGDEEDQRDRVRVLRKRIESNHARLVFDEFELVVLLLHLGETTDPRTFYQGTGNRWIDAVEEHIEEWK